MIRDKQILKQIGEKMDIKEGDVVRLKSGSPKMTVKHISELEVEGGSVSCTWFSIDRMVEGEFNIVQLRLDQEGKET